MDHSEAKDKPKTPSEQRAQAERERKRKKHLKGGKPFQERLNLAKK